MTDEAVDGANRHAEPVGNLRDAQKLQIVKVATVLIRRILWAPRCPMRKHNPLSEVGHCVANRARFRTSHYATRVESAERLKSSRRRSTALLAIVFEQTAAGELKAARSTAHKIEDARKRDRALERIREAEARAAWKLNGLQAIPPKGEFTSGGP